MAAASQKSDSKGTRPNEEGRVAAVASRAHGPMRRGEGGTAAKAHSPTRRREGCS